jgi:hypothetical protein
MRDKNQTDCYDVTKMDKTESFQEQYLPTGYDWRKSNCDEKRIVPCRMKDEYIKHKLS